MTDAGSVFPLAGATAALTAAFLWAVSVTLYHRASGSVGPLGINLFKGCVAIVLLLVTLAATGGLRTSVPLAALGTLLVSGALGIGVGDSAFFYSLKSLGPRRSLLLMILAPPLSALIALVFLGERLGALEWLGIAITLLGVAWVITERSPQHEGRPAALWPGVAFGLISALGQAVGAVLSRTVLTETDVSPLWSTLPRIVAGAAVVMVFILIGRQPVAEWLRTLRVTGLWRIVAFGAFLGTFLAMWLQQVALKYVPVGVAQTLLSSSPVFVLPIAALAGEKVTWRAVIGVVIALAGIALLFGIFTP